MVIQLHVPVTLLHYLLHDGYILDFHCSVKHVFNPPEQCQGVENKDSGYSIGFEIFSEFFTAFSLLKVQLLIDAMQQGLLYLVSGISISKIRKLWVAEVFQWQKSQLCMLIFWISLLRVLFECRVNRRKMQERVSWQTNVFHFVFLYFLFTIELVSLSPSQDPSERHKRSVQRARSHGHPSSSARQTSD